MTGRGRSHVRNLKEGTAAGRQAAAWAARKTGRQKRRQSALTSRQQETAWEARQDLRATAWAVSQAKCLEAAAWAVRKADCQAMI